MLPPLLHVFVVEPKAWRAEHLTGTGVIVILIPGVLVAPICVITAVIHVWCGVTLHETVSEGVLRCGVAALIMGIGLTRTHAA